MTKQTDVLLQVPIYAKTTITVSMPKTVGGRYDLERIFVAWIAAMGDYIADTNTLAEALRDSSSKTDDGEKYSISLSTSWFSVALAYVEIIAQISTSRSTGQQVGDLVKVTVITEPLSPEELISRGLALMDQLSHSTVTIDMDWTIEDNNSVECGVMRSINRPIRLNVYN